MEKYFRTPDYCFHDLKDYPFKPHFMSISNLKLHYLDEGQVNSLPVLLLHGVPAWSYLYRHLINKIAVTGCRVIAPDLIGFGKSDKPGKIEDHTYQFHIECITEFIIKLKLKEILLFCHDWGSLIGLRIAAMHPEFFSGIIVSNGMLPTGEQKLHSKFKQWKFISRYCPFIPIDLVIESGTARKLENEERRAYRAPFPSLKYKAAIRALPGLVPTSPDDTESVNNKSAWKILEKWEKPFLTVFSNNDPITCGGDEYMQNRIPGAAGQNHFRFDAGHFIQEDKSTELADIIIKFRNNLKQD
jgi:haloalkane dehalogenase